MRGMSFDQNQIVKLPELPETANELLSISKILGSSSKSVILGQDATETNLKALDLSKYSIIAFATHGLMANEITGKCLMVLTSELKLWSTINLSLKTKCH